MRAVHSICLLSEPQKLASTVAASADSLLSVAACMSQQQSSMRVPAGRPVTIPAICREQKQGI